MSNNDCNIRAESHNTVTIFAVLDKIHAIFYILKEQGYKIILTIS